MYVFHLAIFFRVVSVILRQSYDCPGTIEVTVKNMGFNSLWPSDVIWRHRSGSTLVQTMACCLKAPSHCRNKCWLIISGVRHLGTISQEIHQPKISKISMKMTYLKFHSNRPGDNGFEAETKWLPFSRRHFQMHFLGWKCMNSDWNFTEVCS